MKVHKSPNHLASTNPYSSKPFGGANIVGRPVHTAQIKPACSGVPSKPSSPTKFSGPERLWAQQHITNVLRFSKNPIIAQLLRKGYDVKVSRDGLITLSQACTGNEVIIGRVKPKRFHNVPPREGTQLFDEQVQKFLENFGGVIDDVRPQPPSGPPYLPQPPINFPKPPFIFPQPPIDWCPPGDGDIGFAEPYPTKPPVIISKPPHYNDPDLK